MPTWVLLRHGRSTVSIVSILICTSSPLGLQGPSYLNHYLTTVCPQPQQSNQPKNNLSPCSKTSRDSSVSFRMRVNVLTMARKPYMIVLLLEHLFPCPLHCPLKQHCSSCFPINSLRTCGTETLTGVVPSVWNAFFRCLHNSLQRLQVLPGLCPFT